MTDLPTGTVDLEDSTLEDQPYRIFIWGHAGCGKTWSLKSLPEHMFPVAIVDTDRGARHLKGDMKGRVYTLPVLPPKEKKDRNQLKIKKWITEIDRAVDPKVFVLDSITRLSAYYLAWQLMVTERTEEKPQRDDFGMALQLGTNTMNQLFARGKPVIVFCHVREEEIQLGDNRTKTVYLPSLAGGLKVSIPPQFDEVYYQDAEVKKGKFETSWLIRPTGQFKGLKTRTFHGQDTIPVDYSLLFKEE